MEIIEVTSVDEDDPRWRYAIEESKKSTLKFKLGAALFKKRRLIGKGFNCLKYSKSFGSKDEYKTLHAEGHAIFQCIKSGQDPIGATMLVYRKNGKLSKPCPCCESLIRKYKIKKVYYTNQV